MKILIVDDNLSNIKLMCGFLHIWGYNTIECYNGEEAIEKYKTEHPDLILMDILMPVMDGREAAREIKSISGNVYIPIIFVTALNSEFDIIQALDSGGDDYIVKPFDKDLLYSKINAHKRILSLNKELEKKNKELALYNRQTDREQELVGHFFKWGQDMCDIDPDYVKFYTSPASAYNGDIFLIKRRPSGGLYVLVGDFTGHGLTAAIGTLPVTSIFFRMAAKNVSIIDIVRQINSKLNKILPVEIFFAATLFEIDQYARSLSVWSGGLPESYIVDKKRNKITTITSDHMPMGVISEFEFDSSVTTYPIEEGMRLYCSTDGVIESFNKNGNMFGDERLKKVLLDSDDNTIECILDAVDEFTGGAQHSDDTTIAEISFKSLDDIDISPGSDKIRLANVLPFSLDFRMTVSDMRKEASLIQIADMLGGNVELRPHKTFLYTIVTELYINALEHGLLGLDSKDKFDPNAFDEYYRSKSIALSGLENDEIVINLFMPITCNELIVTVSHTGKGGVLNSYSSDDEEKRLFGRGLDIVNSLCSKFEYEDYGRLVKATYLIK